MEQEAYFIQRQYDANGNSIDVLVKGIWNGEYWEGKKPNGLKITCFNPKWIYILTAINK